ncbi:MAG: hypothetical protein JWN28_603 [Candidatus Saccharibacteria bacterium]|nr:hypothetical protein [Candidatus Saccharibacteria bacterium]
MRVPVVVTVTRAEDSTQVIDSLHQNDVVYFPRMSEDSP